MSTAEEYDPHLHRKVEKPCTNLETYIHLFKCILGTGILAMPEAFLNAGYIPGFIGTLLVGALCIYCLNQLVRNQYVICKRKQIPIITYPETMAVACKEGPQCLRPFEKISYYAADILIITYQLGICAVYVVFVAGVVKQICDPFYKMHVVIHMLILFIPFVLIFLIRNLKYLAPFSTLANILIFVALVIILYYLFTNIPEKLDIEPFGSPLGFPLFFGTTLFALNAVGVVIALENNMKTPKSFSRVLITGMTLVTLLYAGLGLIGYIRFGSKVQGNVTLALPEDTLTLIVKIAYAIAVFISYSLQGFPVVNIIWGSYILKRLEGRKNLIAYEILLRIFLVILTFIFAAAVPKLGLIISLFGAFCLSLLGISFPALIEICVMHPNHGYLKCQLIKNLIIITIGLIGLIIGTTTTIIAICK